MKTKLLQFAVLLTLGLFVSATIFAQLTTKPVVHWKFDEGTGTTTKDVTGNTGDLTLDALMDPAAAWVDGKYGKALFFDGTDDQLKGGFDSTYFDFEDRSFSMSLWVNFSPDDLDRKSRIITYGTFMLAQTVFTGDTGVVKLQVKNHSGGKLTMEVADDLYFNDEWTLLTFIRDVENQKIQLWANDALAGEKEYGDAFWFWEFDDANDEITIGASTSTDPAKFQGCKGTMDDFRIYDKALSAEEIASLVDGSADVMSLYMPLDEMSGLTASDLSGNMNDGTLANMGDTNWVEGKLFNALEFDGIDDNVTVPYNESLHLGDGPFSFSMWVNCADNPVEDGDSDRMISFGTMILRNVEDDIRFRINIEGAKKELVVPNTEVAKEEWVLLTAIRDTTNRKLKLYANTQLLGELDGKAGNFDNTGDDKTLYIGSNNAGKISEGKGQFYKGMLDELRIYKKALTPDEILDLYAAGNTVFYDLTVEPTTNGSVTLSPEGGVYPEGTVVTLTAIADQGYYLETWGGDASGTMTTTTVTMDADKTVSATFVEGVLQFELTLTQDGEGTGIVARSTSETMIDQGTEVTLTAVASEGSAFGGWTGDVESFNTTIVFTMEKDMTLNANFLSDGPDYDVIATYQEYQSTDTSGINYTKDDPPGSLWTNNPGYTGDGFYDFENVPGTYIEFTIPKADLEGAKKYYLIVRYAHGGDADRPTKIDLNGTEFEASYSFQPTGAWSIWKKEVIEMDFIDGDNVVRFTALAENGMVNFDALQVARFGNAIQNELFSEFNYYPNPASKRVFIDMNLVEESRIQVNVLNMNGQLVDQFERAAPQGSSTMEYDLSSLSSGLYMINIISGNQLKTLKLSVK